jgi:hypothetical protein
MSHAKRGGVTHIGVTPINMAWLILSAEKHGETAQIDVTVDAYVVMSHVTVFDMTHLKTRHGVQRDQKD